MAEGESQDAQIELAPEDPEAEAERELERLQDEILTAVASSRLDTIQDRVAWVLNHHPRTRDSDIELYMRYWAEFEPAALLDEYVRLREASVRPTSLTRARAKIQNSYKLFQASDNVRAMRGTLAEEEQEKARSQHLTYPMYTANVDESGKTSEHVVVGALWFLHGGAIREIVQAIEGLLAEPGAPSELHFKNVNASNLSFYEAAVDEIMDRSSTISFSSISVERRGLQNVDAAIRELHYHLLVQGIEHHHSSGRAPLPRSLFIIKDREEVGRDKLMLADLAERLRQASETRFGGRLNVDRAVSVKSEQNVPVQVADLFVSGLSRRLNRTAATGPKDELADYLLGRLGIPDGPTLEQAVGDMTVHISM
jgi:hypothetical protein